MTKLSDMPLLSVIVPVYGTEKTLSRCFDSVLQCTYPNIELIAVNDCSPGNASEIISSYAEMDSRVHLVEHEKNKGLFLARMTGVAHSHGKYIAFLDSDDHVSVDLYRRLIEKAEDTDSDMVMGEIVMEYPDHFSYNNLRHTQLLDIDLKRDEITNLFFGLHGRDWSLHVVWNKVYRRDLWEKCEPYYELQTQHLNMCEDVLYSTVLFYFAQHFTNIHGDFVYYVQAEGSSTGLNGNVKKYIRNIQDIRHVFNVLRIIFLEKIQDSSVSIALDSWEAFLMRVWRRQVDWGKMAPWGARKLQKVIKVSRKEAGQYERADTFFDAVETSQRTLPHEELKKLISSESIRVISFDIFDTLVQRPLWQPADLFYLLGNYVNELLGTTDYIDFKPLRVEAEAHARRVEKEKHPGWEEITLDDIYREVQTYLGIDDELCDKIKNREICLELQYCKPRAYAKELFELAKELGKQIIITSDMYLPQNVIKQILNNAGYEGYSHLFLSSVEKLTKGTGNLYDFARKKLHVSADQILHIGDNQYADIDMAKKKGWHAFHFPKAIDRFTNTVPGLYGGNSYAELFAKPFALRDANQIMRYWGWRTLLAVAANKIFDNPYVEFHPDTDFNADPRIIGYYALGMHLFAVDQWLLEEVEKQHYANVNFMARDGYLPMEGFKLLQGIYNSYPQLNYLHLTRAVMFPLQMQKGVDLYGFVHDVNILVQTPKKILELVAAVLNQNVLANQEEFCKKCGFIYEAPFASNAEFFEFVKAIREKAIDELRVKSYVNKIGKYLSTSFIGKSATVDVGYSCRVESILKRVFGFDVTPYYMHINNDQALIRAKRNRIDIHTFFSYSPGVTGILRELLISKLEPSCKSLEIEGDHVIPVYKDYHPDYVETYVVSIIQKNALQFIKDVAETFGKDVRLLSYQRTDVSLPFEYYQSAAKMTDRKVFAYGDFEDDLGAGKSLSTFDYWNGQIENVQSGLGGGMDLSLHWIPSKWKRAICLYFINRDYLKYKVSTRFANHPKLLSALKSGYRSARGFYRIVKKK